MKILNNLLLIAILVANTAFSQEKKMPTKDETIDYIDNIMSNARDFGFQVKNNTIAATVSSQGLKYGATEYALRYSFSDSQDYKFEYSKIDFSFLSDITDCDCESANSNLKELKLNFEVDVLKKIQAWSTDCLCWRTTVDNEPTKTIEIYYRDTPGTRDKLIKAFNYLKKLRTEEKAENDIFGN